MPKQRQLTKFDVPINTGSHALTATVEFSTPERSAVLGWAGDDATALLDVALLLSLFTSRSVFIDDPAASYFPDHSAAPTVTAVRRRRAAQQ